MQDIIAEEVNKKERRKGKTSENNKKQPKEARNKKAKGSAYTPQHHTDNTLKNKRKNSKGGREAQPSSSVPRKAQIKSTSRSPSPIAKKPKYSTKQTQKNGKVTWTSPLPTARGRSKDRQGDTLND